MNTQNKNTTIFMKKTFLKLTVTALPSAFLAIWSFVLFGCTANAVSSEQPQYPLPRANQPAASPSQPLFSNGVYGGIEIGAKGVKAIILKVQDDPISANGEGYQADEVMPIKTINTTIMSTDNGRFQPEAINDTAKAVSEFYETFQKQYSVSPSRIFIAGSSGLQNVNQDPQIRAEELGKLSQNISQTTEGKQMVFLTVQAEVEYAIEGVIPKQFRQKAFTIDIGSGNLKGGFRLGTADNPRFVTMGIPYGTVSFTNAVEEKAAEDNTDFTQTADKLRTSVLAPALSKQFGRKPGFSNRKRVYLSGGMAWAMTTLLKPEKRTALVRLSAADIDEFFTKSRSPEGLDALLNPDLSSIRDEKSRQKVESEIRQIHDTFTPQNLQAGATLLKELSGKLDFPNKRIYFPRYAVMGWLWKFVEYGASEEMGSDDSAQ